MVLEDAIIPDQFNVTGELKLLIKFHCNSCAYEKAGIKIPPCGTLNHDAGGGWRVIKETKTH